MFLLQLSSQNSTLTCSRIVLCSTVMLPLVYDPVCIPCVITCYNILSICMYTATMDASTAPLSLCVVSYQAAYSKAFLGCHWSPFSLPQACSLDTWWCALCSTVWCWLKGVKLRNKIYLSLSLIALTQYVYDGGYTMLILKDMEEREGWKQEFKKCNRRNWQWGLQGAGTQSRRWGRQL